LTELRRWRGDMAQHAPRVHGLARAFCALLEEDRSLAREELSRAILAEEANPTMYQLSGRYGLNLLLGALCADLDRQTYEAVTSEPASGLRWDRQFAQFARAVLLGRRGRADEATAAVATALETGAPYGLGRHLALRLVGEAALTDGWGAPIEWLRTAEEYFHVADVVPVSNACRALLRRAGHRVGQRRDGVEEIPPSLRITGVTYREYEVLRLLRERLGNREIAEQLHLSRRTVEKHVSNLMAKTGLPDRIALSRFAAGCVG
jgi:DNA-binding CsgD family transcriptional regulator